MIHPMADVIKVSFWIVAVAGVEDFVVPVGAAGVFVPFGDGAVGVVGAVEDGDLAVGVIDVPFDHVAVTLDQRGDVEVGVGAVVEVLVVGVDAVAVGVAARAVAGVLVAADGTGGWK